MTLRPALLVLAFVLCFHPQVQAGEHLLDAPTGQVLTFVHAECTEIFDPTAPMHMVQPWFRHDNPAAAGVDVTFMRHKFADAFTFSADGKYVAIHHNIFPDAEQLTLRSLDTGENLATLYWRGKGRTLFELRSAAIDGDSRRIVGLAENYFSDGSDAVVIWDGKTGSLIENIEIQKPQNNDYLPVTTSDNDHSFHSGISLGQPYYVRTRLNSEGNLGFRKNIRFSAQIIDWQTKQILNLPDASPNYLMTIRQPLSDHFHYAAVLLNDNKTVKLISFNNIQRAMEGTLARLAPAKLVTPIRRALLNLLGFGPGESEGVGVDSSGPTAPYNARLLHNSPVEKVDLSKWAPFLVTQTNDGLHIWNAKTGEKIEDIRDHVTGFRLLKHAGLLAYTNNDNDLTLYSLLLGREVAKFKGFPEYYLHHRLENREQGVVLVTLNDGTVMVLNETFSAGAKQPFYDIVNTGIRLEMPLNTSYRTIVQTKTARYLANVYESRNPAGQTCLKIDVFSLDGSGKFITSFSFPVRAFQSEFLLDPSGQNIIYTSDETETGIIHLARLFERQEL